jgi:DNA-binding IclR family transcriptional regulator
VTPRDPNLLEEVARELGLPKSKVYNMGFRALLEKLGR